MSRRRGARRNRTAASLAILAVSATGLAAPASANTALRHVPCIDIAASPSFATDHVIFCATATRDQTGVDLYRSTDAGHTWHGPVAVERGQPANDFPFGLYLSPAYRTDHTLYIGTVEAHGYVSTDGGATFTPLAAALGSGPTSPGLLAPGYTTPFLDGSPTAGVTRPELIVSSSQPGGCCDTIYDPVLAPRPSTPSPLIASRAYIVPPDFPSTHQAVVLSGQMGLGPPPVEAMEGHARAFGCTGEFACDSLLYDFAPLRGDNSTGVDWSGPTYPSSPDNYVVILSGVTGDFDHLRPRVYRSTDYGHTWTLWTSVDRLLPDYWNSYSEVYINASPDAPHRLFLHLLGGSDDQPSMPDNLLYRSDDNGATWHRIGYAWGPKQKARSRSTLPWNTVNYGYEATIVEPGGRLYLVAEHDTGKHVDYAGLYCSRDYGLHWSTAC